MNAVLFVLWKREIVKFVTDRSRVIGALAQPIIFWMLLGFGFQDSFALPAAETNGVGYLEYLFPGILALMILFTAIFSTISIIEERKSGFLQAALAAPVSRLSFVIGTTLGGTTLALLQAILLLLFLPAIGIIPSFQGIAILLVGCFLLGITFTALGVTMAWSMQTTRGFHAIMNLFLMPLWLLSGAFFPYDGAATVMKWIILANPVSYAVSAIRSGLYVPDTASAILMPWPVSLLISAIFALLVVGLAVRRIQRPVLTR